MKGWIVAILAAGAVGFAAGSARADDRKSTPNYDGRLLRRHEEKSRQSRIDELRFERARIRARERIATEQYYERIGYSPQRPYVPLSSMSFGGFGGPNVFYGYRSIGWAW
jgi:hypothetical protein